jgi:hypothetical protein
VNSPHDLQKRRLLRWLAASIVVIASAFLAFVFIAPSFFPAFSLKVGRIIDHDSGQGIADADVVVAGWYSQKGSWRDVSFCTYVAITTTDQNGNYHLPSEYLHMVVGLPSADPKNSWYIYASKDGYVKADTKWPLQYDIDGSARGITRWDSRWYVTPRSGFEIQIPPIELMQVDISLTQRIAYFRETGFGANCSDDLTYLKPMRQAVRRFYESVTHVICTSAENDTIESTTVNLLTLWADDTQEFMAAWQALDPQLSHHEMVATSKAYRMGDVCKVARAGISGHH